MTLFIMSFPICFRYVLAHAGASGRAVYGRSPTAIVGSNPTKDIDVCLLCVLCVVR
jgi:hypothetical protein